jgi:SmpA / OmlA family
VIIVATPDFGASGASGCFLLVVWGIVILFVLIGISRGLRLLDSESPKRRKNGVLLLLVSGLIPLFCGLGPAQLFRLVHGNYPIGSDAEDRIRQGMTVGEVLETVGSPHSRAKFGDEERWYYWRDSFEISRFCVRFGPDGRVSMSHGD